MRRRRAEINPGDTFERLTVIKELEKKHGNRRFLCKCVCGNEIQTGSSHLLRGNTKSCGCLRKEQRHKITHGKSNTPLYAVWNSMKGRCSNPTYHAYENYGARGIKVCDEWSNDFQKFYDWAIGNGYQKGMTIERNDVNGHYEPSNCSWIPKSKQSENRRTNHYLTYKGETKTMSQWARDLSLKRETIKDRLKSGWSVEDALTKPIGK